MSSHPPPELTYGLPPPDQLEEMQDRYSLANNQELHYRVKLWVPRNSLIVEFAIMHNVFCDDRWQPVVRVDSCHPGIVHLHQLSRGSSDDRGQIRILKEISAEGWEEVDECYYEMLTLVQNQQHEHLRRFGGDRE